MFMGTYYHNFDKKGRVAVPSKLRERLGEEFIIVSSLDDSKSLYLYPMDEWEALIENFKSAKRSQAADLIRMFFATATNANLDAQGRVCIPATLRDPVNLELSSEAVIIGALDHIEIWNGANWNDKVNSCTGADKRNWLEQVGL